MMATSFILVPFFVRSNDHLALDHPGFRIPLLTLCNLRSSLGFLRGGCLRITRSLGTRSPTRAYSCLEGMDGVEILVSLGQFRRPRCGLIL